MELPMNRLSAFMILTSFMLVLLTGCAIKCRAPMDREPRPLPLRFVQAFSYDETVRVSSVARIRENGNVIVQRIKLAGGDQNSLPIVVDHFENRTPGKKAVILVLPILGGKNKHANQFAVFFAENGFPSLVIHRKKDFRTWFDLDRIDEEIRHNVTDIRKVIDWMGTRPDLSRLGIGILGISMGALNSLMATAVDTRIDAAVLMLAGGNLPLILTHSREKRIIEKRRDYMEKNNLDINGFHERMKQSISLDPLAAAPYMDPGQILLMLALFDRVIPFETGQALRQKMGKPETAYLFSGHYTSVLYLPWARQVSLKFFKSKLGQ